MTFTFNGWPWKTIGHLLYDMSSFDCEFKLESQSGNTQISIFMSRVTLKFDRWPWKIIGHLIYAASSFVHHLTAICEFKIWVTVRKRPIWVKISDFLNPCGLEIWRMTLKNNRTPHLCYHKLWSSFHSHLFSPTWVTVPKRPIWVKIGNFLPVWPWNLTDDLEKQ